MLAPGSETFVAPTNTSWQICRVCFKRFPIKYIKCRIRMEPCNGSSKSYLQYLQTYGLPFPRSNMRSMSSALLLLTTGLMMGATCVALSPGALAPPAGVTRSRALAGAGGASSSPSSEAAETLSRSIFSSSRGTGWTGARWRGAGRTLAG